MINFSISEAFDQQDVAVAIERLFGDKIYAYQLGKAEGNARLQIIEVPEYQLTIFKKEVVTKEYLSFTVPADYVVISFSYSSDGFWSNGLLLKQHFISFYGSGNTYHEVSGANGWQSYDLVIHKQELLKLCWFDNTDFTFIETSKQPLYVQVDERQANDLKGLMGSVFSVGQQQNIQIDANRLEPVWDRLEALLSDTGLTIHKFSPAKSKRCRNLITALSIIHNNQHAPIKVEDLAIKLNMSERSINNLFNSTFNLSPYQFSIMVRLNTVRRLLKDESQVVEKVCSEYGFQTLSRFRSQYTRLFGELPSQTHFHSE
ncbi:hypothetical protein GCM10007895_13510 [Paraferrimonas sedimenticola]|uniref:HTH araC/xylS-type domain-containing protein n=2 Tax=Paraferrimonas sedimenticola TaxID=375674 RepID=A0AA37RVG4_9GAMM|nr:hypothetical protein GCM10007895_13510 [Paraferrimonas sedimenticola]